MISRYLLPGILTALLFLPMALPASAGPAEVLQNLDAAKPDWLPDLAKCPADVMPKQEATLEYFEGRCLEGLEQCLNSCRAGIANDCYASAIILQRVKNGPVPEALFLKACSLGIVSGCTNRAAGMEVPGAQPGPGNECSVRTFDMACGRNDPWACTMSGYHLGMGIGVTKDTKRATELLVKSCMLSGEGQSCEYAKELMKGVQQ